MEWKFDKKTLVSDKIAFELVVVFSLCYHENTCGLAVNVLANCPIISDLNKRDDFKIHLSQNHKKIG